MKTIICGAGDVGYSIADKLSKENFEVTVIDESDDRLSKVSESLDVKTINGTPSLPSVLMDAGAEDCEILIAVTKSDETNMVTCQIGHSLFKIPKKSPELFKVKNYRKCRGSPLFSDKIDCFF